MHFEPARMVHSGSYTFWPWQIPHWWMSLGPADQGAWVAGIGAFAAAFSALIISDQERRRRNKERRENARICAAYLTTDMQRLSEFMVRMREALLDIDIKNSKNGFAKEIFAMEQSLVEVRAILDRKDLKLLMMLPTPIGEAMAHTFGAIPLCCDAVSTVIYKMRNADELVMQKQENFSAPAEMLKRPLHGLQRFFEWLSREFPNSKEPVTRSRLARIAASMTRDTKSA